MLRFRLRRLVPFRVDELRLEASVVENRLARVAPPASGSAGNGGNGSGAKAAPESVGHRALVAFASEPLCAQLEEVFHRQGIRLGWISGATAATLAGLGGAGESEVRGVARVESEGFTLVVASGGEPLVWRQKSFTDGLSDADRERLLGAELRLTRAFLAERFGSRGRIELHLAAPRTVEPFWNRVLEEGFGSVPRRLRLEDLGVDSGAMGGEESAHDLLPLAGAVARRVR